MRNPKQASADIVAVYLHAGNKPHLIRLPKFYFLDEPEQK